MKITTSKFLTIIFLFSSLNAPQGFAVDSCNIHYLPPSKETKSFFMNAIKEGKKIDPSAIKGIDAKIAYLDAVLDMNKHGLSTIEETIELYPKRREELLKAIGQLDFSKGMTKETLNDVNSTYFKIVVGDPYMPSFLVRGRNSMSMNEKLIHTYFTKKAMDEGLISAMQVFLTDAPPHIVRRVLDKTKKIVTRSFNMTFFTMASLISTKPRLSISDDLIRKVMSQGLTKTLPEIDALIKAQSWKIAGRSLSPLERDIMSQTMVRVIVGSTVLMSGWIAYKSYLAEGDMDDDEILNVQDELTQIVLLQELEANARKKDPDFSEEIAKDPMKYQLWKEQQILAIKQMSSAEKDSILNVSGRDSFDMKLLDGPKDTADSIVVDETPQGKRDFIINNVIMGRAMGIYEDYADKKFDIIKVQSAVIEKIKSFPDDKIEKLSSASDSDITEMLNSAISSISAPGPEEDTPTEVAPVDPETKSPASPPRSKMKGRTRGTTQSPDF